LAQPVVADPRQSTAALTVEQPSSGIPDAWTKDQLYLRPRNPPRYDEQHPTGSELEFIIEQIAALRREQAKLAFVILFVGAVLGIVGIEAVWRYFPCGPG
jgi:hypothetical protein